MLYMFCHNKTLLNKDVLLLLLSKFIDSGARAVCVLWNAELGGGRSDFILACWGRHTPLSGAEHSADTPWIRMVLFVISPLYTYILFQNACEDIVCLCVCVVCLYLHVCGHTCGGVHMECMLWVWKTLRRSMSAVFFSLSPLPMFRQGLSLHREH